MKNLQTEYPLIQWHSGLLMPDEWPKRISEWADAVENQWPYPADIRIEVEPHATYVFLCARSGPSRLGRKSLLTLMRGSGEPLRQHLWNVEAALHRLYLCLDPNE